jgi:hypothetical protein
MVMRQAVLTGGCQCGAVRYALYEAPMYTSVCHCRMCQKAVGGAFAAYASAPEGGFAWTRGTPGTFWSSTVAARDFCAACGTPLTFRYRGETRVSVSIGSLDNPAAVTPRVQYGIEARLPWILGAALDAIPGEVTGTDPEEARRLAALTNFQHPDHETGEGWTAPG